MSAPREPAILLSQDGHVAEYICAVCCSLVDAHGSACPPPVLLPRQGEGGRPRFGRAPNRVIASFDGVHCLHRK